MELKAIHHAAIIVSDYRLAREFYVEKLELPVLGEHFRPERNDWKLDLALGDGQLEIFSAPAAPRRPDRPEARGLRPLDTPVELYLVDVHDTGREEEFRTELQMPVEEEESR